MENITILIFFVFSLSRLKLFLTTCYQSICRLPSWNILKCDLQLTCMSDRELRYYSLQTSTLHEYFVIVWNWRKLVIEVLKRKLNIDFMKVVNSKYKTILTSKIAFNMNSCNISYIYREIRGHLKNSLCSTHWFIAWKFPSLGTKTTTFSLHFTIILVFIVRILVINQSILVFNQTII